MKIPNPFTLYEDYYNDAEFVPGSGGDFAQPVFFRILATLKILFINLTFGCILTIIVFKLRRYIGWALNEIFCGACNDCECDEGPRSRPKKSPMRKKSVTLPREDDEEPDECCSYCCESFAQSLWILIQRCKANRRRILKNANALLIGAVLGLFLSWLIFGIGDDGNEPITLIHSFSNPEVFENDPAGRVFVIMPTVKSGIQNARLVRMAQALFPSREFVTWVLVSTDPYPSSTDRWSKKQLEWCEMPTRIMAHLDGLRETVERFGIPFVLLSGHQIHHRNMGFNRRQKVGLGTTLRFMKGSQIGISWVLKTFKSGVLHVALEDAAYDAKLFSLIRDTSDMSSWATAFNSRSIVGVSIPLFRPRGNSIRGYFGVEQPNVIPLEYGSFAVNLNVARWMQSQNGLWKLTVDGRFRTNDLNLNMTDIEGPCGNECSNNIFVWRLKTRFSHSSSIQRRIKVKSRWAETNIPRLMEQIKEWFLFDV